MPAIVEAKPIAISETAFLQADPCVVVIFGATGDLARRKLVPALFHLACIGCMSNQFEVLGVGRQTMSDDEFRARMRAGAQTSKDMGEFSNEEWQMFEPLLHYFAGQLNEFDTYHQLATRLQEMEAKGASANHLFYFATPPSLVPDIIAGLQAAGLAREEHGWSRIVVEKPFGHDLLSARALNNYIATVFAEDQVYRIDHYLGKDTVQNILVFRFGNSLFDPIWNRNYIDYVEITAAEPLGVGDRADYYEGAGASRDMVANHLLQLVALTAMEPPVALDAHSIRAEKTKVWRSIKRMNQEEVASQTVLGQYGPGEVDGMGVPGYRQEPGVGKNSLTETYVALEFRIENWRWAGVPFYVRTGKRLARQLTEIVVHLKRTPQALFSFTSDGQIEPNTILLSLQPDEGISVTFVAKRPGTELRTDTVQMYFCYGTVYDVRLPSAYETLLLDVMQGDPTLFTRGDGVEALWEVITPILDAWSELPPPDFPNYEAGTEGPSAADKLPARNSHRWSPLSRPRSVCGE